MPKRLDKTQTSGSFHLGLEFHRFGYAIRRREHWQFIGANQPIECGVRDATWRNVQRRNFRNVLHGSISADNRIDSLVPSFSVNDPLHYSFPWFHIDFSNFYIFHSIFNQKSRNIGRIQSNIKCVMEFANILYHLIKMRLKKWKRKQILFLCQSKRDSL